MPPDPLACDPALTAAARREGAGEIAGYLGGLAAHVTSSDAAEDAALADRHPPGPDLEQHPAWHRTLGTAVGWGLPAAAWAAPPGSGAHVARAAGLYLLGQLAAGVDEPVSAAYALLPLLRHDDALAAAWAPGLRSTTHPGEFLRATIAVGRAVRADPQADGTYRTSGSPGRVPAPGAGLLLLLGQAPGGPTALLVPATLPDGTANAIEYRPVDALGDRAAGRARLDVTGTTAWRLGAEGDGAAVVGEARARLAVDGVLAAAALVRGALSHAVHPREPDELMQVVLADLALESEAATALALRLAGAADREDERFLRLARPAAAYLLGARAPAAVAQAMECVEGDLEDTALPRLHRAAPLPGLRTGPGNAAALDVLHGVDERPDAVDAVLAEVDAASGADTWFDRGVREMRTELRGREPRRARRLAEMLALCLQGSLLLRFAPTEVSSAFVNSRFLPDGPWRTPGTLPAEAHSAALVARVSPTP